MYIIHVHVVSWIEPRHGWVAFSVYCCWELVVWWPGERETDCPHGQVIAEHIYIYGFLGWVLLCIPKEHRCVMAAIN